MATNDKADRKADREIFPKSVTHKRLMGEIAKTMNSAEWKDGDHKDHLTSVDKIYRLYKKAHAHR